MAVYERNPITGEETTVAGIQDISVYEERISDIEDVIPSDTSTENMLVNASQLGTASAKNYTTNVEPNNHSLVESNAVYAAISSSISSIYKPHGNLSCSELGTSLLIASNVGNIYNMTDSGTTSDLFVQGAGVSIYPNDTVGIIQTGVNEYKFNYMGSLIDLHSYQTKELADPLTIAGSTKTTVESALSALNSETSVRKNISYTYQSATSLKGVIKEILDSQLPVATTDTNIYNGLIQSTHSGGGDMGSWLGYYLAEVKKNLSYQSHGMVICQGRAFVITCSSVVDGWEVIEMTTDAIYGTQIIDLTPYLVNGFTTYEYFNYCRINPHTIVINFGGITGDLSSPRYMAENLPFIARNQRPLAVLASTSKQGDSAITSLCWIPYGTNKIMLGYGGSNVPYYGQMIVID
jgi:hypothetical protein